jgi:DNA modification methylase
MKPLQIADLFCGAGGSTTGIRQAAVFPETLIIPCILCGCPENGIVLDPFLGSGTTAVVAIKNLRRFIGCEINPNYIKIAEQRIQGEKGLFNE